MALHGQRSQAVALLCTEASSAVDSVAAAVRLAQQLTRLSPPSTQLLLLTRGAHSPTPRAAAAERAHGGWWGLGRVLRLEQPALRTTSTDMARGAGSALTVLACDGGGEAEVAWAGGAPHGARLRRSGGVVALPSAGVVSGTWLVTGGLGGLGLRGASVLAGRGAARLVLSSRSGRVAREGQGLVTRLAALVAGAASAWSVACSARRRVGH